MWNPRELPGNFCKVVLQYEPVTAYLWLQMGALTHASDVSKCLSSLDVHGHLKLCVPLSRAYQTWGIPHTPLPPWGRHCWVPSQ